MIHNRESLETLTQPCNTAMEELTSSKTANIIALITQGGNNYDDADSDHHHNHNDNDHHHSVVQENSGQSRQPGLSSINRSLVVRMFLCCKSTSDTVRWIVMITVAVVWVQLLTQLSDDVEYGEDDDN